MDEMFEDHVVPLPTSSPSSIHDVATSTNNQEEDEDVITVEPKRIWKRQAKNRRVSLVQSIFEDSVRSATGYGSNKSFETAGAMSGTMDGSEHKFPPVEKDCCWVRKFDAPNPKGFSVSRPPLMEAIPVLPLAMRLGRYLMQERREKREPMFQMYGMDFHPPAWGPHQGVPLGGMGGGCIGRGFRGDFRRWSLHPGKIEHNYDPQDGAANQFSLRVKRPSSPPDARVLTASTATHTHKYQHLFPQKTWKVMDASRGTCHALYPRCWYHYHNVLPDIQIWSRQVSPVLPHNYTESSLPCCTFVWHVQNKSTTESAEISLLFSFQNGGGTPGSSTIGGHFNQPYKTSTSTGIELKHQYALTDVMPRSALHDTKFDHITPLLPILGLIVCCILRIFLSHYILYILMGVMVLLLLLAVMRSFQLPPFFNAMPSAPTGTTTYPLGFALAAPTTNADPTITTSTKIKFNSSYNSTEASQLWKDWLATGHLTDEYPDTTPTTSGQSIASALAQSFILQPGEEKQIVFSLAWDMPQISFAQKTTYYRRYTDFFGRSGNVAPQLADYALQHYKQWEDAIATWQRPIIQNTEIPSWYKQQLFNELYYIVDGGTVWTSKHDSLPGEEMPTTDIPLESLDTTTTARIGDPRKRVGRFLYLEGHEYLMYNTYDVHFYASFALAMLWPQLELSLQRDVIDVVASQDNQVRYLIGHNDKSQRKVRGAVPHDVGSPSGLPWQRVNDYIFQDVSRWKDLDSKLVLQLYRDFIATEDVDFLKTAWPAVQTSLDHLASFDTDNDGIPENEGFPDQTYDIWIATGPSAYTGGLWLAALSAACSIADILLQECSDENDDVFKKELEASKEKFTTLLELGKVSYTKKLWNGEYFEYDASNSAYHDTIMADQLAGQWYARASGLSPIANVDHIRTALKTVYKNNVMGFKNGDMGAMNGIRPSKNGKNISVDKSCIQSQEVWTGVTYAVSAAMLQESIVGGDSGKDELRNMGFQTSKGIRTAGWDTLGYFFQTPEGWDTHGHYRSLAYMRPLSIWAMQWALEVTPNLWKTNEDKTKTKQK